MNKNKSKQNRCIGRRLFVKSMVLTATAVFLIIIGYITAGYLTGGL